MPDTVIISIIVALIPAVASIICQLIISEKNHRDAAAAEARKDQQLNDRLTGIEKKLDEHNGYAKRIGQVEKSIIRIDTIVSMRG